MTTNATLTTVSAPTHTASNLEITAAPTTNHSRNYFWDVSVLVFDIYADIGGNFLNFLGTSLTEYLEEVGKTFVEGMGIDDGCECMEKLRMYSFPSESYAGNTSDNPTNALLLSRVEARL